jgi:dTDP-4-amino-4,6-dideoxygalactose transaminase
LIANPLNSTGIVPHSRPFFGKEEIEAVSRVIASRHIAQGHEVEQLESEWASATQTSGAVCVASGLSALRLSLHSLGVKPGTEVIIPAYSCIALLNAVLALGATPVLADVEVDRWTLDPASLEERINSRTSAIVAVHLFGMPAPLSEFAKARIPVIEDCAHGIGGVVDGRPFGGAAAASIASFYATKLIAGGEGGIVASNDARLLERVREARNPSDQAPNGLYLNDKLTDLEAAIIRVQLSRLPWSLAERARRAEQYGEMLRDLVDRELIVLPRREESRIWYRYSVRLTRRTATDVSHALQTEGIFVDQPVWDLRKVVAWPKDLRGADLAFERLLSLPLYPDLTSAEQERVCVAVRRAVSG